MMHYKIRIRWDRRKRVPKGVACTYILLGFFSLYCMLQLFSSPGSSLDNLCELRIHIDNINLMDSHEAYNYGWGQFVLCVVSAVEL